MNHYTQNDIALGKLRLKIGKPVEPELAAAILGYGIKMDGPTGPGGVSIPAVVGPDAAVEQLRRVGPGEVYEVRPIKSPFVFGVDPGGVSVPSLAERAASARLPGRATARRILGVLDEVAAERQRQDARWGQQNHPSFLGDHSGVGSWLLRSSYYGVPTEWDAKRNTEDRFRKGIGTYGDIFIEEVAEAIGASSEDRLREELVQCAAVAVAWIEAIDRRKAQEQKS